MIFLEDHTGNTLVPLFQPMLITRHSDRGRGPEANSDQWRLQAHWHNSILDLYIGSQENVRVLWAKLKTIIAEHDTDATDVWCITHGIYPDWVPVEAF